MSVSFNEIPKNWRVPLLWAEIDPTGADMSAAAMPYSVLIPGYATKEISNQLVAERMTSAAQVGDAYGVNSLLAAMARAWFEANTTTETKFIALPEPDGAKASLEITFTGATPNGGNINFYIGADMVSPYVAPGATAVQAVSALQAAITAAGLWTATISAEDTLKITAPHNGSAYNGVMVRFGYYQGEEMPAGLAVTFSPDSTIPGSPTPTYAIAAALAGVVAFNGEIDPARPFQSLTIPGMLPPKAGTFGRLAGGSGAPNIDELFAALGDKWFHILVSPWTDEATLAALKNEAVDRFEALTNLPLQIISCATGSHTNLGTLGDSHNSPHLTILGDGGPFTAAENNLLLFDGISTWMQTADGGCAIQRLITTYKMDNWGSETKAYLDLNTLLTLTYLRYSYKIHMTRIFPRHKLADDGTNFGVGQAIATPSMIKGETFGWFKTMEELGLVENASQFKNLLIVERDPNDQCRVNIVLPPNLVNQLRVMATKISFKL